MAVKKINPTSAKTVEQKVTPPRALGGKFVSIKKNVDEAKKIEEVEVKSVNSKGPYLISFSGHDIRRFYQNNTWYFSLDDIARIAETNQDNTAIRKGDSEKLEEGINKCSLVINGIKVAKAEEILPLIPYYKGNMPGQLGRWLERSSQHPMPVVDLPNSS